MKHLILNIVLATMGLLSGSAQHLIGFDKDEVPKIVQNEMKGFSLDNSSVNSSFNYLKFINAPGTKTLIVFFNDNNKSTNVRLVCDYSELSFVIAEYNSKYKPVGKYYWEYTAEENLYQISLEEKEWYFVIYVSEKTVSSEPSKRSWLWRLLN